MSIDAASMITVFTSCWNQGEFLSEAIESVLRQTHLDFEYLIYDDGSTDDTREVMRRYCDSRIKTFHLDKQANVGCVINKSIKAMSGDAWVWCPADDVLLPELLETKLAESEKHSHRAVLYSDWEIIDERRLLITQPVILPHVSPQEFRELMRTACPIGMTGIWIPKKVFDGVGPFPEHLDCSEDFYWAMKALDMGVEFHHIPKVLYRKRKHENSTTAKNPGLVNETVKRIRAGRA